MPIIAGYDDQSLGPQRFGAGTHPVTISHAKLVEGETKAGNKYTALDVGLEGAVGEFENHRIFLPADTAEWQEWEDWKRRKCKSALTAIGIRMDMVEDETARENLIGKFVTIKLTPNKTGDGFYFDFQGSGSTDATTLPLPEPQADATPPVAPVAPIVV